MDKKGLAKPRVYQTKIKIYPDGSTVLTVYKNAIVYRGSAEKESVDFDDVEGTSVSNNCVSVLNSEEKTDEEKDISRLEITIHEGKNRQVRRMCESVGRRVIALHRSKIGNIGVKDIELGKWRYLKDFEVKTLIGK